MEELAKLEEERVNPAGVIAPAIVATFVSTAVAVVYCKVRDRKRRGTVCAEARSTFRK